MNSEGGDAELAYVKIQQAIVLLRTAVNGVLSVESKASGSGLPCEMRALELDYACSVDLRSARITLEAVEDIAFGAYEEVAALCGCEAM